MLSRLRQRGLSRITQSFTLPLVASPLYHEHIHRSITTDTPPSPTDTKSQSQSAKDRPMKKPIVTGRNSKNTERDFEEDKFPNPFIGKDLPYGRKIIFDNQLEEDLADGNHWHQYNDRFMQHFDIDFVERGWGNLDLYKSPMAKRGMDDITMSHDMDYHYKVHNIGMHLEMMRYIPHLKPFVPELKADFECATAKWQDIVDEILGNAEDETTEEEEEETSETTESTETYSSATGITQSSTTKYQMKRTKTKTKTKRKKYGSYKLKNMINEERPLFGDDSIKFRKQQIKDAMNPNRAMEDRKELVKREIELNTIKKFVDDKVEEKDFVRLVFMDAMGTKYYVYGVVGETLLQCCRRYLIPIDGYCNGFDRGIVRIYDKGPWCHLCQMDISPKFFHLIPPFDWRERLAFVNFRHLTPTSRLGCSVWIRPEFDGMLINIPVSIPNPYGRFSD